MVSPKDDLRYSGERIASDRYYEDRASHCYREVRDERDMNVSGNSLNSSSGNLGRRSQEPPDPERGTSKIKFYVGFVLIPRFFRCKEKKGGWFILEG